MGSFWKVHVVERRRFPTGSVTIVLIFCAFVGVSADVNFVRYFGYYSDQTLSDFNDELITGITDAQCAVECLTGTTTVPFGFCRSFDYEYARQRCVLSREDKDTVSQSLHSSSGNRYHQLNDPFSYFTKRTNMALNGYNTEVLNSYNATQCALRCMLGTATVPTPICRSFEFDKTYNKCTLSVEDEITEPGELGTNTRFDFYQRNGPCDSSPCQNNGTCRNDFDSPMSYTCTCSSAWTGDNCETDIDECLDNGGLGPCSHTCTNNEGSYTCSCNDGYSLNADEHTCDDINECSTNGGRGPCAHVCTNAPAGSYTCLCNPGYILDTDRHSCSDIDECADNTNNCDRQHATCTNTVGSFTCACISGYYGDGRTCTACGHCAGDAACNTGTGACSSCQSPWTGQLCQQIPAEVTSDPQDITQSLTLAAVFTCSGRGEPMPTVTWQHGGSTVTGGVSMTTNDAQHTFTSTLSFSSVQRADNGQYTCTAANGVRTDTSQHATLIVRERPEQISVTDDPTSSTLQATVHVGFTGNLPITAIQVRYRRSDESTWSSWTPVVVAGTEGTIDITGLTPATDYMGEVQAQNDEGWSDVVQFTWRTRDAPPGRPSDPQTSSDSHSISLTWQEPAVTNGVITHYSIQYGQTTECSEVHLSLEVTTTDSTRFQNVPGLIPYTTYSFRVRAFTIAGPGDFTDCVTAKTTEYTPTEPTSAELADLNPCNCETTNQPRTIELQARWRRPQNVYGELRGYNLKLQQQNLVIYEQNITQDLENEELVHVVPDSDVPRGLEPAQGYFVMVSAYNDKFIGEVKTSAESQTSDGCPTAPSVYDMTQEGMCAVNWTEPSGDRGNITGYSVIVTASVLLDAGLESAPKPEHVLTSSEQDQEWTRSLVDLPAYSLIHVTVRAKTCAKGEESEEITCRVERIEPPKSVPTMNLTDSKPTSTSFQVSLPQVSQRSGPISCYQVIVVKMTAGETLDELAVRLGEPNNILTSAATTVEGKTVPYIAKAFSGDNVESAATITLGRGEDCTDPCCQVGAVEGAPEPGNRELSPGSTYTTVIRAYVDTSQESRRKRATSQVHTSSKYSTPVTTATGGGTSVGGIIGGVLAVVAVLCIIGVGLFFYRRRLGGNDDKGLGIPRRPPKQRVVQEDDTQMGAIGPMDEEAVEVKKSPAPKPKPKPHRPSRRGGASPSLDLRQPIPIHRLEREFARRHANDDQLFVEEYSHLPKPFGRDHAEAYYNEENASRNKFRNIIAYDRGLVKLTPIEGVPGSGYIHASYMDGYQEKSKFIAAQGPMDNTIDDFWRMIWETGSTAIVMVTNLEENGKKKCSQYWPTSGEKIYATDLLVRLEDTVKMVDHVTRTFLIKKTWERRVRKVTHFHFIGWPDFGLPKSPMGLLKFHRTVMSALTPRDRPIVVHCSAGVGRTGTFITVDAMLDMIRAEGKVDVFGFVEEMRQNRSFMVQTEGQYVFIFKAILEYYLYGDTETEVANIHRYMQKLKAEDPQTGKTGIETEFGKLTRIPIDKANMRSGNLPENLSKNRVLQVLPYDTTRVFLQQKPGVKGADYINASFIDGYNMKDAYIATQGPLDRTVEDFWRMVWEWNSCSIVMLTEIKEKSQNKCTMYWSEDGSQSFGDFTVSLQDQTDYQDYTLRTFHVTKGKGGSTRTVQQFHFHGWPEVGIPDNASGMIDLIGQVQKQQQHSGNGPITVHCSAGAGRTGAFCAISTVLERVKAEGVCDVFQVVKALRLQRPHMVQTLDQYQFCYQAVVEYLDSFDHYANFR